MSMNLAIRAKFEPVRRLAFGGIGANYAGVGTAIDHPARQFIIQNFTDVTLSFSFDGINDHFDLVAGESFIEDITSNKTIDHGFYIDEHTRLYVRECPLVLAAPSSGFVSLSVVYGTTGY